VTVLDRSASLPWALERPDVDELFRRPAWQAQAACRGMGVEMFFPVPGEDVDTARAICARCGVRPECLAVALESGAPGVWGGTTGKDRRKLKRASA
jgi:WhiB family redox-sensing transcriptional regulator